MKSTLEFTVGCLDQLRARGLRLLLSQAVVRNGYTKRSTRLLAFFVIAAVVNAVLALSAPLIVLALGPAIFGIPHLAASWRYTQYVVNACQAPAGSKILAICFATVVLVRLGLDFTWVSIPSSLWHAGEWLALLITFLSFRNKKTNFAISSITMIIACGTLFPVQMVATLLLVHNAIAFVYWRKAAPRNEVPVVWTCFFIFLAFHFLIFSGAADAILAYVYTPGWTTFILRDLRGFLGRDVSFHFLIRFLSAYAFGQSVHYFIWLKAIPEQCHVQATPTSYRQSLSYLRRDLGVLMGNLTVWAAVAFPLLWKVLGSETTRTLYFALAAYHGFMEIAGALAILGNGSGKKSPEEFK